MNPHHNLLAIGIEIAALAMVAAMAWIARGPRPMPMLGGFAVGVGVFALVLVRASVPTQAFYDFTIAYYPAGRDILEGDFAALRTLTGPWFVNLPIVAYLFAPVGTLAPLVAAGVFTVVGVALTGLAWWQLVRLTRLGAQDRWLMAFLFLLNGPLICGVKFGNLSYVLLAPMIAALGLIRQGRSGWAGVLLGLVAVIKPPLALFGLFFLLRRDWRGLLGFAGLGAVVVLASLAVFGWSDNWHWFEACILQFNHGWLAGFTVQSVPVIIARTHQNAAALLDWTPYVATPAEHWLADGVMALMALVAAVAVLRPRAAGPLSAEDADRRRDLQYLLVLCLALVVSPLAWSHYYAWFLIPTAFFLKWRSGWTPAARGLAWIAIALAAAPVVWPLVVTQPLLTRIYVTAGVSSLFVGAVLWFALIAWQSAAAGGWLVRREPRLEMDAAPATAK